MCAVISKRMPSRFPPIRLPSLRRARRQARLPSLRLPRCRRLPLRPHVLSVPTSPLLACRTVDWTVPISTMPLIDAATRLRFGPTTSSVNTHATNSARDMTAMTVAIGPRQVRPRPRLETQQRNRHQPRHRPRLGELFNILCLYSWPRCPWKKARTTSSIRFMEIELSGHSSCTSCPNDYFFLFLAKISPELQLESLLVLQLESQLPLHLSSQHPLHLPSPPMPPQRPLSLILLPVSFAPTRLRHK